MQQRSVWEFSASSPPLATKHRPPRTYVRKSGKQRLIVVDEPLLPLSRQFLHNKPRMNREQRTALNSEKEDAPACPNSAMEQAEVSAERRPQKRTLRSLSNGQPEDFSRIFDELWNDRQ